MDIFFFFLRRERSRVNGGKKSCGVNKNSKGLKVDISVERERGTALMDSEHVSQLREQYRVNDGHVFLLISSVPKGRMMDSMYNSNTMEKLSTKLK